MSEVDTQPRDESTGQFTPSTEGLFGREHENAKAGFTTKKDPPAEEKTYSDTLEGVREAARDLSERRGTAGPVEISMDAVREHVGKPDLKEAVTPEQAAQELATARGEVSKYVDGLNLLDFAGKIDKARAEEMKNNPRAVEQLGLSKQDIEAAKNVDSENPGEETRRPDTATRPDEPGTTVEGLDPEVEKALKHPQVRQAIEDELGKAASAQQSYAAALQTANQFAMASLVDHFPELANIPVQNWEAALHIFAQSAPDRFNNAMGTLQRVSQLQNAQAQWQQHQAQVAQQQFAEYARAEDDRFEEMIKGEPEADRQTIGNDMLSYAKKLGVSREQLLGFLHTPEGRSAPVQKMIYDAVQYDKVQNAKRAIAAKPLPPVQRPGVSTGRSAASDNKGKIATLQSQLAGATGDKAARIAAQIRTLSRRSA